jgi:hypothetical protein
LLTSSVVWHGGEEGEGGFTRDVLEELGGEVLAIGKDKGPVGAGRQDTGGQIEKTGSGLGGGASGGSGGEGDGLAGFHIDTEESLGGFDGGGFVLGFSPSHLTLGVTFETVGVDGEEVAGVVTAGAADGAESHLQLFRVGDGMLVEKFVDFLIGGEERETVGQFEALLGEGAGLADPGDAKGGLVDELEGQAAFHARGEFPGPGGDEIPGAETQMFGKKKPDAHLASGNLVGQKLPGVAFQILRVRGFPSPDRLGALGLDGSPGVGFSGRQMEFFFAGRKPGSRAGHSGC